MVGPIERDDRSSLVLRLKLGFVVLIAASAGLMAVHGGADAVDVAVVTLAGLLVGAVVVWVVFPGDGSAVQHDVGRR